MYKSVIRDGKFLVLIVDGIFDAPIMELPSEELADKVAYELQSAWDQGVAWASEQVQKTNVIDEEIRKIRAMTLSEKKAYYNKIERRNKRIERVEQARR